MLIDSDVDPDVAENIMLRKYYQRFPQKPILPGVVITFGEVVA